MYTHLKNTYVGLRRWGRIALRRARSRLFHPPELSSRRMADQCVGLVSVVNDAFRPYMEVLLASVLEHNPAWDYPWNVIHHPIYSPLSELNRRRLAGRYPNIHFQEVSASRYEKFLNQTPEKWLAALFTLETFSFYNYDRVVFLDADMLCLGPLDRLVNVEAEFSAAMSGGDYALKEALRDTYTWDGGFNSGVMVVGKKYLNPVTYAELFEVHYNDFGDQEILNNYFRGKPVYLLPQAYNFHAEFFYDHFGSQAEINLLHYAGIKPHQRPDLLRMKPWFDARRRYFHQD